MNYNKVEGESLAIYSEILMNRQYLFGTLFTVMSDYSALPRLPRNKNLCDYGSCHPNRLPDNLTED